MANPFAHLLGEKEEANPFAHLLEDPLQGNPFAALLPQQAPSPAGVAASAGEGDPLIQTLKQAGFKGPALRTAWAIAKRESGGRATAYNPDRSTGDDSYGLFQINMLGGMGPSRRKQFGIKSNQDLLDPLVNAKAAYQMSKGGSDWGAWGIGPNAYRKMPALDFSGYEEALKVKAPPQGAHSVAPMGMVIEGNTIGAQAVRQAATQLGKPYQFGSGPSTQSFDCSDLVQWSYRQLGIELPRDTAGQMKALPLKSWRDLQPGDPIYRRSGGHVVIYAGGGKVIAAPHTGTTVQYQSLSNFPPSQWEVRSVT